ncbi:PAS domain-containing hybrid sensor histidine kinase/response regulator [Devosia sp. RR2S18]|uniref:PAS domain-containing hybrid sensor histidine kinase/response regulator n=1 Tax=Devosia rhizosphaerae TaxID=3049774 RepID=UPI002540FC49|nr:PAS domain-containing hybrid sensor histidine kinase/response regulator [Devosia sp. RR2S18]WIJ23408.1 ATP-binding protein [Devosia sp. RR2S18]
MDVLPTSEFVDLFERAPCGYVIADSSGRIIRANTTLADWIGTDTSALTGKRFQDLLNIAGKIYYETHFAPLLRMQGFFNEVALDLVSAGGQSLPVLVNAAEARDEHGPKFLRITIFNATDRRRYERELLDARAEAQAASAALKELNAFLEVRVREAVEERLEAEERLRQAQKMEAIGQLTGGVAHDFNNLLTVIIGGLDTINRQIELLPESEPKKRILRARNMAAIGAQRAASLTSRLLAFSRRQPLDPKPLNINKLLREVSDLLHRTLGEAVSFEAVEYAGLWPALVDPSELSNALVNLAVNARDAMPEGGRLTIETSNIYLDEPYLASFDEPVPPGQYVLIAVSDTGTGMDKAMISKVFEPFFTTKEAGKGTGLGLSQVYGFIRQSGGHIRIYSELGQGTSVKLYLPRASSEEVLADPELRESAAETGSGTILICEDEPELRNFGAEALRELGYQVLEAGDGHQALDLLAQHPTTALLFTDVGLPNGMNGRQLADRARQSRPDLKVLFTTGYTRNAIVHHGRLDPGVLLLTKPYSVHALAAKVRQAITGP